LLLNFATKNNIDPNVLFAKDKTTSNRSLWFTSKKCHENEGELILNFATKNYIDPNHLFAEGGTPLYYSLFKRREKMEQLFLDFTTENKMINFLFFKKDYCGTSWVDLG
jgi:hypothetical protein